MKNYEKPVVMVNEGLAEGVYAASGSDSDHWSCTQKSGIHKGDSDGYQITVSSNYTDGNGRDNLTNDSVIATVYFSTPVTSAAWKDGHKATNVYAEGGAVKVTFSSIECRSGQNYMVKFTVVPNEDNTVITDVVVDSCNHV